MNPDVLFKAVPLQPGDKEYEKTKSEFFKSAGMNYNIVKVDFPTYTTFTEILIKNKNTLLKFEVKPVLEFC